MIPFLATMLPILTLIVGFVLGTQTIAVVCLFFLLREITACVVHIISAHALYPSDTARYQADS